MITTQTVKLLKKPNEFDNLRIEKQLSDMGFNVIRWAIIDITETELILSVSHSEP